MRSKLATLAFLCAVSCVFGQDTLRLSLTQADSLLLVRNLSLIASRYDVDKAQARAVQASLFDNPDVSAESFLYSPDRKGVFDPAFQKSFSIQQLLKIAGQRGLAIDLAENEKVMSSLQYAALARALKYQLHTTYYSLYYLSNATKALSSQLLRLHGTVRAYQIQYEKGNFSLRELARLKATLFQLNNVYTSLQQEISDLRGDLRILIGEERAVIPLPSRAELAVFSIPETPVQLLVDEALRNRTDVALQSAQLRQSELRLSLERRKAYPDVRLGLNYDQGGSIINHYTGLSVGLELPIFNRNQGAIAEAEVDLQQVNVQQSIVQRQVRIQIETALEKLRAMREEYDQIGSSFLDDIDTLSEALLQNYLNGNLSLLEFTDLFESYNSTIIDINRFYALLFKSYEDLNYAVGRELFR